MGGQHVRTEMSLEGDEEIIKALRAAGLNVKKSTVGAVRKGGKVIRDQAERNASAISSAQGRKVALRVKNRKDFAVGSIYPAKGHAELRVIEYGTTAGWRWARKRGPFVFYRGKRKIVTRAINHPGTKARRWLLPAFESKGAEAAKVTTDVLWAAIEQARIESEGADDS